MKTIVTTVATICAVACSTLMAFAHASDSTRALQLKSLHTHENNLTNMAFQLKGNNRGLSIGAGKIATVTRGEIAHLADLEELEVTVTEQAARGILNNKLAFRREQVKSGACVFDLNNLGAFSKVSTNPSLTYHIKSLERTIAEICKSV